MKWKNIKPFFSVFTPTFRTGDKIYRTYNSLKNQLFKDWEWVIVDDSDNDDTWNVLQEISEKDFRVKRLYHNNEQLIRYKC